MAKIYDIPEGFEIPVLNFTLNCPNVNEIYDAHRAAEKKLIADLSIWCKNRNPSQEHIGEIIDFPVADGKAVYMVITLSPLQLMHIPIGDAWHFDYVHRLTKKDVVEKITREQAFKKSLNKQK